MHFSFQNALELILFLDCKNELQPWKIDGVFGKGKAA